MLSVSNKPVLESMLLIKIMDNKIQVHCCTGKGVRRVAHNSAALYSKQFMFGVGTCKYTEHQTAAVGKPFKAIQVAC